MTDQSQTDQTQTDGTSTDPVTLTVAGHVATICLNRPAKRNAVSLEMLRALLDMAGQLRARRDVRAVVLCGAGAHFSAGIDTALFTSAAPQDLAQMLAEPVYGAANIFQAPCMALQALPVPVIAALEGTVFGAGLQIALGADLRIAAADARLSVMEIKWGLIPDMGLTTVLPRLMRADQAKEAIWTGRILSGDEAQALGLVTRQAQDPKAEAQRLAAQIAQASPDAVRAGKRLVAETWEAGAEEALRREAALQSEIMGRHNQIEAVMAVMQKRAAGFQD